LFERYHQEGERNAGGPLQERLILSGHSIDRDGCPRSDGSGSIHGLLSSDECGQNHSTFC
jgi:hypothetical protein